MKDIYELLNYVEIEANEIPEIECSEVEKERVKKNLNKCLKKKNYMKPAIAASVVCCSFIVGIGILGITNPTYAADIPIIGDIFRYVDNGKTGAFDKYKENSNEINIAKESNDISITIKDAVFDGYVLSYTYEVSSKKDLGESISLKNDHSVNSSFYGGHSTCKKIGNGKYIGISQLECGSEKKENINAVIVYNEILGFTDHNKVSNTKGEWKFNINLDSIDSELQIVDENVQKDGININIESIQKTPMSFTVRYSQEFSDEIINDINNLCKGLSEEDYMEKNAVLKMNKNVRLEIKDDLGNEYVSSDNLRGGGDDMKFEFKDTFNKIDENAHQLIITPKNSETVFDDIIINLK